MSDIEFSIILPTYKRPEMVGRSVMSVVNQTYSYWRLYIVIDDTDQAYNQTKDKYKDNKQITFIQNSENVGKNKSLNIALNKLTEDKFKGFIIFLDDDDWLSPDCLKDFVKVITENPNRNWFVSERANADTKKPYTINKTGRTIVNYMQDMLLTRKFSGDTTQCLNFESVRGLRFPTLIKNAEEWLYFAEVAKAEKNFLFLPTVGTYSLGYATDGLTYNYHNKKERWLNNSLVLKELLQRKLPSLPIVVYFIVRLLKSFIS